MFFWWDRLKWRELKFARKQNLILRNLAFVAPVISCNYLWQKGNKSYKRVKMSNFFLSLCSCRSRHSILCPGISWWAFWCPPCPGWKLAGSVCCTEWWGVWDQRAGHLYNWTPQQHEPCLCNALPTQDAHSGRRGMTDGTLWIVYWFIVLNVVNAFLFYTLRKDLVFNCSTENTKTIYLTMLLHFWVFFLLLFLLFPRVIQFS